MADLAADVVLQVGSSGRTSVQADETPATEPVPAPEKKLTLFALRLAILEKIASSLGSLGFVWATVVLLGGFAGSLATTDFWFVTVILVVEGARIFCRSHELELQHYSKQETRRNEMNPGPIARTRTWKSSDVPMMSGWVFKSRNVSRVFSWLQIGSALASIFISMFKLIKQDYGGNDLKPNRTNLHSALTLFYSLALAESLLFLVEKAYWEWMIRVFKILEKVNKECGLESFGMVSVRRFFYDAYSKCLNGSIFDGLKMDMVIFAMELLVSNSPEEQLIGTRILCTFSTHNDYSVDTLQKIGMNLAIIERLVEMLNWRNKNQEDARMASAEILSRLASKTQNALRVAGISGAIESISSLLESTRGSEIMINCGKIGKTKGLLSKIIDFTYAERRLLEDSSVAAPEPCDILAVKRSLKLLKKLVSTTGATGKNLRKDISGIVFTVSNIRETLRHGNRRPDLQKLGAEILIFLAFDEGATEKIGGTGGVLKGLLFIFLNNEIPENESGVRVSAGESIAMLAQGSKSNCQRILRSDVLQKLVEALNNPLIQLNAARILRNLCAYTASGQFNKQMQEVIKSAGATVLKAIKSEESKLQEVMVGLAPHILKLMSTEELRGMFEKAEVREEELAKALISIFKRYEQPVPKVPRIRRFAIELTIEMMKANAETVKTFENLGMKNGLETVLETATELENFDIFSGTVGLARHGSTINELIEEANKLLS
ncbi:hypothetical protein V5N11_030258 [Cardamine amara subsp. amara]|uniref:ARM repeat superfamily protein n=1 Tax=Cardamine amara subsp. amara TaxID=228776 RepID=A0ABD0ZZK8_CARAN